MKYIESGFIIFRHKTLFELSYSVMKSDAIDWILDHLKIKGDRAKEWQKLRRSGGYNIARATKIIQIENDR